jgi:hypothetical protein
MSNKKRLALGLLVLVVAVLGVGYLSFPATDVRECLQLAREGFRPIADKREERFLGKVKDFTARCRGPESAQEYRATPWVDWSNYWGAGDNKTNSRFSILERLSPDARGIDGALLDLEYQRIELIKFNLFDNYTFKDYVTGRSGVGGRSLSRWTEMRLPTDHPNYADVGGAAAEQQCSGELVRYRTLTGICNDVFNPLMGSSGTLFARNVQFEETWPDLGKTELTRNRHGERLGLLKPDPQVISRVLFTRQQTQPARCNAGAGLPNASIDAECDYVKAPFFNVLAAFWIQFMTHDWFSHMQEGRNNASQEMEVGCKTRRDGNGERPLTPAEVAQLGCRPGDRMDRALVAQEDAPPTFTHNGQSYLGRAHKTTRNSNTAWWDASQIYGYDPTSQQRVKRDPADAARLLMVAAPNRQNEPYGYLPLFTGSDPVNPVWNGQEAAAFPDNWSIGMSFYHNLFVREHNAFVDEFRRRAQAAPNEDSGLRNPARPDEVITHAKVTPDELYQAARLVVSAEIAKIHTIEWTTQLLYDEVLYRGMNANWHGLFRDKASLKRVTGKITDQLNKSDSEEDRTLWYGVVASGSGIFGLGSQKYGEGGFTSLFRKGRDTWSLTNPADLNGGVNHFGSPFNFPEEFITVYRLHPLVPDLIDFREVRVPNDVVKKVPVIETFRGKATQAMREGGLSNWALSLGRQRLGALALQNHPQFLQNLPMPRINSETKLIDVAALDIIRDRERGIPRFNEFRRQYGLRQLTSFDDFVDKRLPADSPDRKHQENLVKQLRDIYGSHVCDASKVITAAQLDENGNRINDCLGKPNGSVVDNIEDVDMVVGWLAESTRPHGFAISETQFTVFIINASRRLFSDRFFTSSFRPEFYTSLGVQWVNDNGPTGKVYEKGKPNGHREEVSPLKRIMLRTMPELADELEHVVNVFDPWARDRGSYYSLEWKPRKGAENDPAFVKEQK